MGVGKWGRQGQGQGRGRGRGRWEGGANVDGFSMRGMMGRGQGLSYDPHVCVGFAMAAARSNAAWTRMDDSVVDRCPRSTHPE
eukprot:746522-Hanusia_phi.AAC.4